MTLVRSYNTAANYQKCCFNDQSHLAHWLNCKLKFYKANFYYYDEENLDYKSASWRQALYHTINFSRKFYFNNNKKKKSLKIDDISLVA